MRALGTDPAIQLCEQDAALADRMLADLAACMANEIEVDVMLARLRDATQRFQENSARFEGPIGRTVEVANRLALATVLPLAAIVIVVTLALFRRIHRILLARDEATEALFESERRHWILAHHDALTGLPNRILLRDRLEGAIARADRKGWLVGLAFIDLDRFKLVNDTWGHAAGDRLIRLVAARIRGVVRKTDTIARYGGDEFVVLLEMAPDQAGLVSAATKILEVLSAPFSIEGAHCHVRASLGLAIYPDHARDGDDLLRKADFAMYGAKAKGRNRIQLHPIPGIEAAGRVSSVPSIRPPDRDTVAFDEV
jgi:diguanylate cyclase (GGDEF)-like protein